MPRETCPSTRRSPGAAASACLSELVFVRVRDFFSHTHFHGQPGAERHHSIIGCIYVWLRSPLRRSCRYVGAQSDRIVCDQVFLSTGIDEKRPTEGDFTLAISAFSPTHLGDFLLLVRSSRWVEVDPIPQEGAGMFAKTIRGEWCVPPTTPSLGGATDPLYLQDKWWSWSPPALFPPLAHVHRCQVSSRKDVPFFSPVTFSHTCSCRPGTI